jgi:HTH-type transcriptional regulator/antitoxin HigA
MSRHPGLLLRDVLAAQGMTQVELCRRTELSAKHMSRAISGQADIGPTMALRLESALGIPAEVWLVMQVHHDLALLRVGKRR